jgi:hypothetical protein
VAISAAIEGVRQFGVKLNGGFAVFARCVEVFEINKSGGPLGIKTTSCGGFGGDCIESNQGLLRLMGMA